MSENLFRNIPSVNQLLAEPLLQSLGHSREQLVEAIRAELVELRKRLLAGENPEAITSPQLADAVAQRLHRALKPKLQKVINATGIVLHTNLGRAPILAEAAEAARQAAAGYLNLELDLTTGKRSSRQDAIREWVCRLTGAEAATVVNNNAAATVIVLRAITAGKEVIISRGQLVEIGGSFRIPEIMAVSGAILSEVGTTNITRIGDYERAITPNTGGLLQVHLSNFRVSGFTESASLQQLVELGRKYGVPVIDDIGSGALFDFERFGFREEPVAKASIAAGADLILFSGDKLLGGPQAGIIAGKQEWIRKIEKDPLMRAFRLDKMTLAALEATLRVYLDHERAMREIPILRMLGTPLDELRARAENLAVRIATLPGIITARAVEETAFVGGGSLPDQEMPCCVVEIEGQGSEERLASQLRTGTPAVMGRIRRGRLVLDVRTVFREQEQELIEAVRRAAQPE
jgi:L-seryl-tRNA(Ser) seleniumtransferase